MRLRSGLLVILVCLALPVREVPAAEADPNRACANAADVAARADCWVSLGDTFVGGLRVVDSALDADPATALEALARMAGRRSGAAVGDQAWHAELRARALGALDRVDESLAAWDAALALHDGTDRLEWVEPRAWSVALDVGDGRLVRAARAFAAAGRAERARALAARAMALGERAESVEIWEAAGGGEFPVAAATTFLAPPWRDRLPEIELPMFEGQRFTFEATRGKVVVVDFWASWCGPCIKELPFLDALYREYRDAGLEAVAVNYQEPPDAAMAFAQTLGLEMPIAIATREAVEFFDVKSMPTVVIADRDGGVRARWEGYEDDVRVQMRDLVEALLTEEVPLAPALGEIYEGEGTLEVRWIRGAREPVLGVGFVELVEGEPRIAAVLNRSIDLFRGSGHMDERVAVPPGVGRVISADVESDGTAEVVSYRPGGRRVVTFGPEGGAMSWFDAPAALFSLAARPGDGDRPGELLLATLDGVVATSRDGETQQPFGDIGAVSDVAWTADGTWVIDTSGRIQRLDRKGRRRGKARTVEGAWSFVGTPGSEGGFGVTGFGATAIAVGRFLGGPGRQAALALSSGQLVVIDLADGHVVFRAHLDEAITGLATGDENHDGTDELYLSSGQRFALIHHP